MNKKLVAPRAHDHTSCRRRGQESSAPWPSLVVTGAGSLPGREPPQVRAGQTAATTHNAVVRYEGPDGDLISVSTDDEVEEALRLCYDSKTLAMTLIAARDSPAAASPQDEARLPRRDEEILRSYTCRFKPKRNTGATLPACLAPRAPDDD